MTQNDAEWTEELEESAQGTHFFEAPGQELQASETKSDADEYIAGASQTADAVGRVVQARQRRHSLKDAMTHLETVVASPAGADHWVATVRTAMKKLALALKEHIEVTEGDEGLLEEILRHEPRFAAEVDLIRAEHEELEETLERAFLTLEGTMTVGSKDPEPIRRRVMTVLGRLSLHRQRGADLVFEAYNVDIATGD